MTNISSPIPGSWTFYDNPFDRSEKILEAPKFIEDDNTITTGEIQGASDPATTYVEHKLESYQDLASIEQLLAQLNAQQNNLKEHIERSQTNVHQATKEVSRHKLEISAQTDRLMDRVSIYEAAGARRIGSVIERFFNGKEIYGFDYASDFLEVAGSTLREPKLIADSDLIDKNTEDTRTALEQFNTLRSLTNDVKRRNDDADRGAMHLIDFLQKNTESIWTRMRTTLGSLTAIGWPHKVESMDEHSSRQIFKEKFLQVLLLEPNDSEARAAIDHDLGSYENTRRYNVLLPFEILAKPLAVRFRYHFDGNRPTNQIDKPEWFFVHTLRVLEDHLPFVSSQLQQLLNSFDFSSHDAINEFISAVLQIIYTKLSSLLPIVENEPQLVSHLIAESLNFDTAVRNLYGYLPYGEHEWKGTVDVIIGKSMFFDLWMDFERNFANERYERVINSDDAWQLDFETVEKEDTKPSKSALRLKDLLSAVTDRYREVPSAQQRLQFLINTQLSLLDSYHNRLTSSLEAFESLTKGLGRAVPGVRQDDSELTTGIQGLERLCRVYGSSCFMQKTLELWDEDIFFLKMWQELISEKMKNQQLSPLVGTSGIPSSAKNEDQTLFQESFYSYQKLSERTEKLILHHCVKEAISSMNDYLRIYTWGIHTDLNSSDHQAISPELTKITNTIRTIVQFLEHALSQSKFLKIFLGVANELQQYFWDWVVMRNKFSVSGVGQLSRDISELTRTFGIFFLESESYFQRLQDACTLLSLPTKEDVNDSSTSVCFDDVVAMLMRDEKTGKHEETEQVLSELGVKTIDLQLARQVLRQSVGFTGQMTPWDQPHVDRL
ncbi:RAD50-interacting protein 1 [Neolecta irregularis DAH-3]|uniref:RAD50-interacting protein 1 n=1 Tax=Neolecta irregularis (strain DAH-3) TaxID=1198029 RepID=A0A1U7LH95_NEOID|nr:RAD50-interacting protein 1 [Neolecta irregularis DAH-3]|eukprot:OLL21901.1 RAD50-interacting protein 1 [Neolecta irregularis DAH-3]